MSDPDKLTLIVAGDAVAPQPPTADKPEDFEEQALPAWVPRIHERRPKDVDLSKLKEGLQRVQKQIDGLLAQVNQPSAAGFKLQSVEVALAITAEGSIGVATAGVEASVALTFERKGTNK